MKINIDFYPSAKKHSIEECSFHIMRTLAGVYWIYTIGLSKHAGNDWISFEELSKLPNLGLKVEKKLKTYTSYPLRKYTTRNGIKHLKKYWESIRS